MKKLLVSSVLVAITLFSSLNASAQKKANKFKGIIKMEAEYNGQTVPLEVKVYEDKIYSPNQIGWVLVSGTTQYSIIDFSQIYQMLQAGGVEMEGSGKMYVENTFYIDSALKENNTKVEYFSDTKKIEGFDVKKATVTAEDEEGNKSEIEVWYTEEIGPEYSVVFIPAVKGFPLEYTIKTSDNAIHYKTKEIKKGGVKEAEFLLPAGYEKVTQEKIMEIIGIIQENMGGEE